MHVNICLQLMSNHYHFIWSIADNPSGGEDQAVGGQDQAVGGEDPVGAEGGCGPSSVSANEILKELEAQV
jgi:hypothetical protein